MQQHHTFFLHVLLLDLPLIEDFDGHFVLREDMLCNLDLHAHSSCQGMCPVCSLAHCSVVNLEQHETTKAKGSFTFPNDPFPSVLPRR